MHFVGECPLQPASDRVDPEDVTWLPTMIVVAGCLVPAFGGVLLLASRRAVWSNELEGRRAEARELTEHRRRRLAERPSAR